jgi:hypothetical protein
MLEKTLPRLESRLADPLFELLAAEIESALAEIGPAETLEHTVDEIFDPPPTIVAL